MSSNIETSYRANPLLKRCGVQLEYSEEDITEYVKCASDPIYFIENYFKIITLDHGLINIKLYDYQKTIIDLYHNNKFVILKLPRQSAKTTTTVAYILWLTLFNDSYIAAILANKGSLAREILDRYQLAYEQLPPFLQQGVNYFNKGSVELENGSRVLATSTSSSSIRGFSINFLYCDEIAHIHNNLAEEFFTSVFPTISSGTNTKLVMSSTPKGQNMFYKYWTDAKAGRNGFVPFEIHWSQVPGRDEDWEQTTRAAIGKTKFAQEYGCEFIGSTNTLITPEKLSIMVYKEPINHYSDMYIYEEPIKECNDEEAEILTKDHLYAICVDVSEGKNLDYSAFSVFDISTIPYKQVATYRSNTISPLLFPNVIKTCAEYYNKAHVLIEINNNPQVAQILHEELEYENVFKVSSGNKQAQALTMGFGRNIALGLKMTGLVKRVGCSTLKTIIDNNKLVLNDYKTISELTTFVQIGSSFSAEEACNDDLAMTCVIFAWLATQKLFKEIVEHDLRKQLQFEHFNYHEEAQLPIIEKIDGTEIPHFVEDGCVWTETAFGDPYQNFFDQQYN